MEYTVLDHESLLPYADDQFDVIIAASVLEHVPMEYETSAHLTSSVSPYKRSATRRTSISCRWSRTRRVVVGPCRALVESQGLGGWRPASPSSPDG